MVWAALAYSFCNGSQELSLDCEGVFVRLTTVTSMIGLLLLIPITGTALSPADPDTRPIGLTYTKGDYSLDGAKVRGNATLFEHSRLDLSTSPVWIHLDRGTRIWLAPHTSAQVSSRGVSISSGLAQLQSDSGFPLVARALTVVGAGGGSVLRVMVEPDNGIVVMPVAGTAQIRNSSGLLVGDVSKSHAVRFSAYTGQPDYVTATGCLQRAHNQFSLTDEITNVTLQLTGGELASNQGRLVRVIGSAAPAANSRTISTIAVRDIRAVPGECGVRPSTRVASLSLPSPQAPSAEPARELSIAILEGDNFVNNIRRGTARDPVVEVRDRNRKPVAGALVLFALPESGPSGTFANGARTLSVTTDQQGRAVAKGLQPNKQAGQFQIVVTASLGAQVATATITQTNVLAAVAAGAAQTAGSVGFSTAAKVSIIGGIAAATTVTTLVASGAIFSDDSTEPPASR